MNGPDFALFNDEAHNSPATEYEATLQNRVLLISPDPFHSATVALRVLGRRIPARRYQHDGDLREAVAAVAPEVLAGHARGVAR